MMKMKFNQPFIPLAHEDEEVTSPNDTNNFMEDPSDMVDHHIDDFIYIGRCRWDVSCFIFYGDPIYDMEGSFQMKNVDVLPSKKWYSFLDDPVIQHLMMIHSKIVFIHSGMACYRYS
jgi:hypothetical protein